MKTTKTSKLESAKKHIAQNVNVLRAKYPNSYKLLTPIIQKFGLNPKKRSKYWVFWAVLAVTMFIYMLYDGKGIFAALLAGLMLGGYAGYVYLGGQYVLKPKGIGYLLYILPFFLIWQMATGTHSGAGTSSGRDFSQSTSDPADPNNQYASQDTSSSSSSPPSEYVEPEPRNNIGDPAVKEFIKKLPHKGLGYTIDYKTGSDGVVEFAVQINPTAEKGTTEYDYQLEQSTRAMKDYIENNGLRPIDFAIHNEVK